MDTSQASRTLVFSKCWRLYWELELGSVPKALPETKDESRPKCQRSPSSRDPEGMARKSTMKDSIVELPGARSLTESQVSSQRQKETSESQGLKWYPKNPASPHWASLLKANTTPCCLANRFVDSFVQYPTPTHHTAALSHRRCPSNYPQDFKISRRLNKASAGGRKWFEFGVFPTSSPSLIPVTESLGSSAPSSSAHQSALCSSASGFTGTFPTPEAQEARVCVEGTATSHRKGGEFKISGSLPLNTRHRSYPQGPVVQTRHAALSTED